MAALLRGANLGARNRVAMADLRALVEAAGGASMIVADLPAGEQPDEREKADHGP